MELARGLEKAVDGLKIEKVLRCCKLKKNVRVPWGIEGILIPIRELVKLLV